MRCTEAALFGDRAGSGEEKEKGGGESFILYFSVPPGPKRGKVRRGEGGIFGVIGC